MLKALEKVALENHEKQAEITRKLEQDKIKNFIERKEKLQAQRKERLEMIEEADRRFKDVKK
jgi:hypothetical protein